MNKNVVRRAYDQNTLARVLTLPEDQFGGAYGMTTVHVEQRWSFPGDPKADYYHFRDNGSSVLAVAHLDTVVKPDRRAPYFFKTGNGPFVRSGALDDRLGAYVILHLLPKLGVSADWLLTTGEESGQSTAEHFKCEKDYDWIIEFDRTGTDVVMYQYEDSASRAAVKASGAKMGQGSFSDIAYLEHLGVKAFNWGVGYQGNYHSENGYAFLGNTFGMVTKYLRFHEQNLGLTMPHEEEDYYGYKEDKGARYLPDCIYCGTEGSVDSVTWYCTYCGVCQDCGATDPDVAKDWDDPDADVCQCYTPQKTVTLDDEWITSRIQA